MSLTPPDSFLILNAQNSKNVALVIDIEGLALIVTDTIYRPVEYGDLHVYGESGLEYGDTTLYPVGSYPGERQQKSLLMFEGSSLSISQMLEPESGRASISTLSMTFVDKDSYMSRAIASGPIVDEILGRQVKIWLGFQSTSFPNDYFVIWRGRVGQAKSGNAAVTLQFVDPNAVRRQTIFYTAQTQLTADIASGATTITVDNNEDFHRKIAGPSGAYDTNVRVFIKIDDEFIEYQNTGNEGTGFGTNQFLNCQRGISPTGLNGNTTAAAHTAGANVQAYVMITGNIMELALKVMMSGWGGPYLSGQALQSLYMTIDPAYPTIAGGIVLPDSKDAVRDLGLAVGDYVTITGSVVPSNNVTTTVTGFQDLVGQSNRVILTAATLQPDMFTAAVISMRSQYDTFPDSCGCQLPGWEVDVQQFQYFQNTFLSQGGYTFQHLINASQSGKTFIENAMLMPAGAYSLTRQGKISVGLTKPPIAGQQTQILTVDNVIDPKSITAERGINNRKFFNEIDWEFDFGDDGNPVSVRKTLDSDSLDDIGISSVIPMVAPGARSVQGFLDIVAQRETYLLNRYARASVLLNIKTTLGVGNQIEVGDIVFVNDNGELQITNFTTGARNLGAQVFEVIGRTLDFRTGITSLILEGGTGAQVTDRYATVSPSSLITAGSTSTEILITESFGNPANEQAKWQAYVGLNVRVHDPTYAVRDGTTTFVGFDPSNTHGMLLAPALGFTPQTDDVVDIAEYPNDTDANNQALYKLIHAFIDPSVAIVSGASNFAFDVGGGDVAKFQVGYPILVHNTDYSSLSVETTIASVAGTTITVVDDLGFTPDNTMKAELLGFLDNGQPYRLV